MHFLIAKGAFSMTNINALFFPSKLSTIDKCAFEFIDNIQIIEISEESELKSFPFSAFDRHPNFIDMIPLPVSIKIVDLK